MPRKSRAYFDADVEALRPVFALAWRAALRHALGLPIGALTVAVDDELTADFRPNRKRAGQLAAICKAGADDPRLPLEIAFHTLEAKSEARDRLISAIGPDLPLQARLAFQTWTDGYLFDVRQVVRGWLARPAVAVGVRALVARLTSELDKARGQRPKADVETKQAARTLTAAGIRRGCLAGRIPVLPDMTPLHEHREAASRAVLDAEAKRKAARATAARARRKLARDLRVEILAAAEAASV